LVFGPESLGSKSDAPECSRWRGDDKLDLGKTDPPRGRRMARRKGLASAGCFAYGAPSFRRGTPRRRITRS